MLAGLTGIYLGVHGYSAPRLPAAALAGAAGTASVAAASPASTGGGSGKPPSTAAASVTPSGGGAGRRGSGSSSASTASQPAARSGSASASHPAASGTSQPAARSGGNAPSSTRSQPAGGSASPNASPAGPAACRPKRGTGPVLAQTQWGQVSYQLYPGNISARARQALSGFHVSFQPDGPCKEKVTVGNSRGGPPQSAAFDKSDRLYLIEAGMGDDGFGEDGNFGDDSFVLTDAGGRLLG